MIIRKAELAELDEIMKIFDIARQYMRENGNMNQWINGYPSRELITEDIEAGQLFVCIENDTIVDSDCFSSGIDDCKGTDDGQQYDGKIHGVFAFILGDDPTYHVIEGGSWLNDEPYGTIHRMASDGVISGILEKTMPFCLSLTDNVRIDTHADNEPMLRAVKRYGFSHCGVIYVADGSPREAFHYSK
ncbi:MAG: N-acetyltransferase [Firmicutes bacterium]|nr:N-acetyltransferase [Bacillota bacterium]